MYFVYRIKDKVIMDKAYNPLFLKLRSSDSFLLVASENEKNIAGISMRGNYYPLNYMSEYAYISYKSEDAIFNRSTNVKDYSDILPGYTKYYQDEEFIDYFANDIRQIQRDKQEENKQKFNEYLNTHPVTFNDKQYGTTLEDQLEIALVLSQATAAVLGTDESPKVEWHAKNEANEEMSVEDLLALQAKIKEAVGAPYKKMQEYKVAIFNCEDAKTLVEMNFEYEEGATE